jgi:hypothetical protein
MIGLFIGLVGQAALASAPAPAPAIEPSTASLNPPASLNPHATELFDRDAGLKAWALRRYDRNHDGWLTLYEAQPALAEFKAIADADRDGRVTTYEFARAKAFVAARW